MRTYLHIFGLMSVALALAGCAGYQPLGTTFIRADGQDVDGEQLAADRNECANTGDKLVSCMSGKGYALVREDEVAQKQKEFAEAAEKKKQEQAALAAAEKKKQAALRRAAAKKKASTKVAAPAAAAVSSTQAVTNAQAAPWPQDAGRQTTPWPQR